MKSLNMVKITQYLTQMCILMTLIDSKIIFEKFLKLGKIWQKNGLIFVVFCDIFQRFVSFWAKFQQIFWIFQKMFLKLIKFIKIHNWLIFLVIWAVFFEFIAFFHNLLSIFPIYFLLLGILFKLIIKSKLINQYSRFFHQKHAQTIKLFILT